MTKRYAIVLMFFLANMTSAAAPLTVKAATLYVSPSSGSYYEGENFKVNILVSSDMAVNGVSGVLNFPTRYVKVVNIDKGNSVLNFWIEEPSFSNAGALGNIQFEGVALNPGFMGSGENIVTVTFRADQQGTVDINFNQSAILANDGLGTNVNASIIGAHFILLPQRAPSTSPTTSASSQKPQIIFVKELPQETPSSILSFWEAMPGWVQISTAITIGLATIIFSLIILSLGIIVLVWLWSNIWYRRYQFLSFLHSSANTFKNVVHKTIHSLGMAEREIEGDVNYGVQQLAEELKTISQRPPSFRMLMKNYSFRVYNIVKRFFIKNIAEDQNEPTQDK